MKFSKVALNSLANYGGQFWIALMGFIFVPYYILFLGIEAYGVLGFCASLTALTSFLDLGLSSTTIRETARLSILPGNRQHLRDLLRTLEVIYWVVAFLIATIFAIISYRIPGTWIKPNTISEKDVQQAIMIMGAAVACRWPFGLYSGGLRGLQQQVLLNWIMGLAATLRGLGGIAVIWMISPTIQALLLWQIMVDALQTLFSALFLWHALHRTEGRPVFRKEILSGLWRFSAGVSGASILWIALTQMDKIALSKILPLNEFGYYCLASVGAGVIISFVAPLQSALYARFSELISLGEEKTLSDLYHKGCQTITTLTMPATGIVVFFSFPILMIWTSDQGTSANTHLILSILAAGTGISGLLHLPHTLQISYGWTWLSVVLNAIFTVCLLPLLITAAENYGAVGAASVWLFLNATAFLIVGHIMHRRILKGQQWQWYIFDVGLPTAACLFVVGLCRLFMPCIASRAAVTAYLAGVMVLSMFAAAMASSRIRPLAMDLMKKVFGSSHNKRLI